MFFKSPIQTPVDVKLKTKILSENLPPAQPIIKEIIYQKGRMLVKDVFLYIDKVEDAIGHMQFSFLEGNPLFIDQLHNKTDDFEKSKQFRHVGNALVEYAFRESFKFGLNGQLSLECADISISFWYLAGFRVKPERRFIIDPGAIGVDLNSKFALCFQEYKKIMSSHSSTPEKMQSLQERIESTKEYEQAKEAVDAFADLDHPPTFQDVMRESTILDRDERYLKHAQEKKLEGKKGEIRESFGLYLPPEKIREKAEEYGLLDQLLASKTIKPSS